VTDRASGEARTSAVTCRFLRSFTHFTDANYINVIPEQISHGGSQGFKSPHLHPTTRSSERRQRRAGGAHCTLRPQHGRKRRSQSSQEGLQRPGDSTLGLTRRPRSVVATSLRRPAPLPAGDPRTHPASSAATRSTDHCSTPSRGDGQVQANASAGPAGLRQPRSPGSDSGSRGAGRGHSGRLRARPSQPCGYLPTASPHRLPPRPPGRTQRTRERTDTGHPPLDWTPDGGHRTLRRPHRTPDSVAWTGTRGRCPLAPDTGRCPRRGQGDEGTAGIRTSWAVAPNGGGLGHPTVFLGTVLAALGNHDDSAVGHLPARDCRSHYQAASRSLRRGKGRLGALLSSERVGSRVERQALGQVSWQE
jgi:hypothetical protein